MENMDKHSNLPAAEFVAGGMRGQSTAVINSSDRNFGGALLSTIAADLDRPDSQESPAGASDMDRVYMKHQALVGRNEELRKLVETLTFQQGEDRRGHAAELLRVTDQVDFLKAENGNLKQQRDTFAEYSIGLKARMESLTKVMMRSAQATEEAIGSTMVEIERFVSDRLDALRLLQTSNAETATALVKDALDAAAAQGIVIPLSKSTQAA